MAGDFDARIAHLAEGIGVGDLEARLEVDQVYARYQHEGLDFAHPRGGQAKFLEEPLYANAAEYLRDLGNNTLRGSGAGLTGAAIDIAEDLSAQVQEHAPVEFGDLRNSGHPTVTDDGATVYDRPPAVHRLSEEELRAKHRSSELPDWR